ncbi:NAD-dependent epimerase/dehydratase family protein [Oceanicella sp. SM1341]|uniref:NAD-dependent epimerase/dehydratase family protein n=1 Tax=Oceanicella sp. SM1341 TaxID=1548889 RepID=UPI000E554C34|nr:NAD-dependent epimerase/dehydratase family protein [Oceanicella sp. SM1341]
MTSNTRICVAGATGLVGSAVLRLALARGHHVHGTLRDATDTARTAPLMALPGAAGRLTLFSADAGEEGAFDAAMHGCDAAAIACFPPLYKAADGTPARALDRRRGYEEIVRPVRDGVLNVLGSARRAGVGSIALCSSTSSTNPPVPLAVKHEATALSDAEAQMADGKFTAAEKIVMETAALDFCVHNDMRLAVLLPTMMLGPVVLPEHMRSHGLALLSGLLEGRRAMHEQVPAGSMSVSHLEDVAALFLATIENPQARGRYFAVFDSLPWAEIYDILARHVPAAGLPAPLDGAPEPPTRFDFTRRDSLGVTMRDIPATIAATVDWLKTRPFPG